MSTISKARAALKRWRTHPFVRDDWFERASATQEWGVLTSLIVGTAGNPALWDALDAMLRDVDGNPRFPQRHAERIAEAILLADKDLKS